MIDLPGYTKAKKIVIARCESFDLGPPLGP